jgi:hypothetical protein
MVDRLPQDRNRLDAATARGRSRELVGARGFEPPITSVQKRTSWSRTTIHGMKLNESHASSLLRYPQKQDSTWRTGTKRTQGKPRFDVVGVKGGAAGRLDCTASIRIDTILSVLWNSGFSHYARKSMVLRFRHCAARETLLGSCIDLSLLALAHRVPPRYARYRGGLVPL